jgi:hypothetical protein
MRAGDAGAVASCAAAAVSRGALRREALDPRGRAARRSTRSALIRSARHEAFDLDPVGA